MRILQVITLSELGGAQTVVAHLANSLSAAHTLGVVAGEGDGKMWSMLDDKVERYPCKHLKRALSPADDWTAIWELRRIYRRFKPDVVHLHSSKAGMLGRVAFPARKIIYTVHGFDSIRVAYRKFLPLERIMQYTCRAIVGVSRYDEANLRSEGITRHVSCVYNGIAPVCRDENLSLQLGGAYSKVVLCIARLAPPKRCDLFLEVARLLPQYAFVWIGNQTEVSDTPSNVFFLGNIPQASRYNHLADLFMLASDYEGLPMVVLEALSCSKPVVASNVGGIREIVHNGRNGYVVENQAQLFADKIAHILADKEVYQAFAENACRTFNETLTVEKMREGYMNIYGQL